jgi:hypothetical protein
MPHLDAMEWLRMMAAHSPLTDCRPHFARIADELAMLRRYRTQEEVAMRTFQVTRRELVYIDRTYEVDAENGQDAIRLVEMHRDCKLVDEQIQDTHSLGNLWISDGCD